jgi:HUS1 checkpoint protein
MGMLCTSANATVGDQNLTASTRMDMAIERGEALSVVLFLNSTYLTILLFSSAISSQISFLSIFKQQVNMKHLVKSLHCHLAKPDCTFYGVHFSCNLNNVFCVEQTLLP